MIGYKTIYSSIDLPQNACKGEVMITLQGEPTPWVFNGSHWNRIYGVESKGREHYYIECPYCNSWIDVRVHSNCPNCTAPLNRKSLNNY